MAKPVVDGLEQELAGQAEVVRVAVMSQVGMALAGRYGVRGVPTMLVFDGNGQVVYARGGQPDREAIIAVVEELAAP